MNKKFAIVMALFMTLAGCTESIEEEINEIIVIPGCNDSSAFNYDENATNSDACLTELSLENAIMNFLTAIEQGPTDASSSMGMTVTSSTFDGSESSMEMVFSPNGIAMFTSMSGEIDLSMMMDTGDSTDTMMPFNYLSEQTLIPNPDGTDTTVIHMVHMNESQEFTMNNAVSWSAIVAEMMADDDDDMDDDHSDMDGDHDDSSDDMGIGIETPAGDEILSGFDVANSTYAPALSTDSGYSFTASMLQQGENEIGASTDVTTTFTFILDSNFIVTSVSSESVRKCYSCTSGILTDTMSVTLLSDAEIAGYFDADWSSVATEALPFAVTPMGGHDDHDGHDDGDHDGHDDGDHDGHDDGDHNDNVDWESYIGGYCEWEGNPNEEEVDVWSCKDDESDSDWDTWWYYCELHGEDWHCTDDFGQSPNWENSADETEYDEHGDDGHDDGNHDDHDDGDHDDHHDHGPTFICGDGTEIPFDYVNDGDADCDDGADEQQYDTDGNEINWFDCMDGSQVWISQVNDGTDDCPDGEDEAHDEEDHTETYYYDNCEEGDGLSSYDCWTNEMDVDGDGTPEDSDSYWNYECEQNGDGTWECMTDHVNYYDNCVNDDHPSDLECWLDEWDTDNDGSFDLGSDGYMDGECVQLDDGRWACSHTDVIELFQNYDNCDEESGMYECWNDDWTDSDGNVAITDDYELEDCSELENGSWDCFIGYVFDNDGDDDDHDDMPSEEDMFEMADTNDDGFVNMSEIEHLFSGDHDDHDDHDERTFHCSSTVGGSPDTEIPFSQVNDGTEDCGDGSDEPQDTDGDGTVDNWFDCVDGSTVSMELVNDGNDDCPDGDDESHDHDDHDDHDDDSDMGGIMMYFNYSDSDGDGLLSAEEFTTFYENIDNDGPPSPEVFFSMMDSNGDGMVTGTEYGEWWNSSSVDSEPMSENDWNTFVYSLFTYADSDDDGQWDFDEFLSWYEETMDHDDDHDGHDDGDHDGHDDGDHDGHDHGDGGHDDDDDDHDGHDHGDHDGHMHGPLDWLIVEPDSMTDIPLIAGDLSNYYAVLSKCTISEDSEDGSSDDDDMMMDMMGGAPEMECGPDIMFTPLSSASNPDSIYFHDADNSGTLTYGDMVHVNENATSEEWTHVRLYSASADSYSDENPMMTPGFTGVIGMIALLGAALLTRRD